MDETARAFVAHTQKLGFVLNLIEISNLTAISSTGHSSPYAAAGFLVGAANTALKCVPRL
jgi:hypothetical protein